MQVPEYSSWLGRGLAVEELWVEPSACGRGIGQELLQSVAKQAEADGRPRLLLPVCLLPFCFLLVIGIVIAEAKSANVGNRRRWLIWALSGWRRPPWPAGY